MTGINPTFFTCMVAFFALSALSSCTGIGNPAQTGGPSGADLERMAAPAAPPSLVASDSIDISSTSAGAATASASRFRELRGTRMVEVSEIPWLRASPEGALFIKSAFPRALARGEPAQSCPAASASDAGAGSRKEAASSALYKCLEMLERRDAAESCGCRLVAVDDTLLTTQEDFIYAPGVPALMMGPGEPLRLVAETVPPIDGVELVSLRAANGEVARLALGGEVAELLLMNGEKFSGAREPFGYRRGRLAERLTLTSTEGTKMTLLIGVEASDAFRE